MRASAIIFFVATMCCSAYHASADELIQLAQATPNVVTPTLGLSTPITSTVTNLHDELQLAGGELPNRVLHTTAADANDSRAIGWITLNPTANQTCTATCGSTQLACQSSCALLARSP
jgi:hypothetical protein